MIFTKDNPIGLDFAINGMQVSLGNALSWTSPYIYGRMYLNTKANGKVVAEAYTGSDGYKDVLVDKSKTAVIGFVETSDRTGGKIQVATVDIVCSVMLNKIYDSELRNDEEALQTIIRVIDKTAGWTVETIRTGNVTNVFNFMDTSSITFRDMQPYANFAIRCKVNYLNNICKL